MADSKRALAYYYAAHEWCCTNGFQEEIDYVTRRRFEDQTVELFVREYAWVLVNSGMKNAVAEKIFQRYLNEGYRSIGHPGKRKAIQQAEAAGRKWFQDLQRRPTTASKISFLETLPWIGPTTKYHLARNLGLDVAKPDRHLVRLAQRFGYGEGYPAVEKMCNEISRELDERVGVIDVVLWRYMAENRGNTDAPTINKGMPK